MIRINLLEYRQVYKKIIIQKQLISAVGIIFSTIFTLIFITKYQNTQIIQLQQVFNVKQGELNKLKSEVKRVEQFEKKEIRLKEILKIITGLKQSQSQTSKMLDFINNLIPNEIWLTSLMEKGKRIDMKGFSFSNIGIASFMKNLNKTPYFKDIELIGSEQSVVNGKKMKKFTIICVLNLTKDMTL